MENSNNIAPDFEYAFNTVQELVKDFKAGEKHYLSKQYQEAEVRKDFIDKFWIALGWDVHHNAQKNPFEQEVKVEKGVSVSGAQKRADYSFSLGPNYRDPRFFVEAKKPAQNLHDEDYYFQTIRYGWHKNTPLAVLTDFEEFHVLDCRYSPDINTILSRQVKRFHYTDYSNPEKFAYIYWLFSRQAVLDNSIEKISENLPKPKGKSVQKALFAYENLKSIDEDFLQEIEEKREILAKALKKNDEELNSEELTEATQKIIDRLVFIRFLEDKLIEQEHHVASFGEKGSAWNDFISLSRKFEAKYSGIVFKRSFIDDPSFKGPVGNEFYRICQDLCHLNSRFLYNEIPIHILGSIYERFLGKVVHATDYRVKIEEKPEVRKAGGVYYTPKYIVDYIIQNTVGTIIENKSPEQISKMRFIDIACGSGSFLIGVFDFLLNYYNKYYQKNPQKAKKDGCHLTKDGIWVMSIRQKQSILRNNIYGVDIDSQAVEVTQLSLALKMLEDETTATANEMQVLFHEKILPDMTKNIVCGNSLIGTNIFSQNLFSTEEEEKKLNPMDFEKVFPEIMRNGGFDAIVGNPPYVVMEGQFRNNIISEYYKKNFESASYKIDLYHLFIEKGIKLLNQNNSRLGFITPSNYLSNNGVVNLRNFILENSFIDTLNVIDGKVFKASVDTVITILSKEKKPNRKSRFIRSEWQQILFKETSIKLFDQKAFKNNSGKTFIGTEKIEIHPDYFELGQYFNVNFGMQLRDRKIFMSDVITADQKKLITKYHRACYVGRDINEYITDYSDHLAFFNTLAQMGGCWDEDAHNTNPKILVRQIGQTPICSLDEKGYCCLNSMFMITPKEKDEPHSIKYILGILNSKFIKRFWTDNFSDMRKTFPKIKGTYIKKLPIPLINFKNKEQKELHDKTVILVDDIIKAKKAIKLAKTDKDLNYYESKSSSLISEIDVHIYKLYQIEG